MATHALLIPSHVPPGMPFLGDLMLAHTRAHEFCGPARRTLALMLARAIEGPVFWITPGWSYDRLNGEGLSSFIDPGRITFVTPSRAEDMLWSMEEALRAGCVPLVVCDCPGVPGLTSVRRLHLAAETALKEQQNRPVGLLLCPGNGGAQGVESRWHMAPAHHEDTQDRWRLSRRRDRLAPPMSWRVTMVAGNFVLSKGQTV